ncbi:MAG: hypothetical protein SFV51_23165, partial [Bryobacteraceae bacterium]|nr:hypothetical protein [Bryobacteraceae bacterium]
MRFRIVSCLFLAAAAAGQTPSELAYKQPYKQMEWPRPAASAAGTPAGPWNFIQVAAVAATPQGNILVLHR